MGLYTNHCNLLDMCAIAVPENTADTSIPFGITIFSLSDQEGEILGTAEQFLQTQSIPFAVCGLHKKGFPLESQLTELGASYRESVNTAPHYRLYRLDTVPEKPGMVYDDKKGAAIAVDIYELPVVSVGAFLGEIRKPLCIGNVELSDGRIVKGFLCEEYGLANAKEITDIGKYEV
jgi:allophanate hydrolase